MKFFMSSEVDASIADEFRIIRNEIAKKLKTLENINYGNEVESIGVIPIVVNLSPELEAAGFHKERKLFSKKKKDADFRLRINYGVFFNGDGNTKKLLVIKNVVESIRALSLKASKDFDATRLENDILNLFEVDKNSIDSIEME